MPNHAAESHRLGVGLGISLGCLVAISAVLVIVGICVSKSRADDVERELARRREALLQHNRQEQQQWRERRLHDVVLALVERNEATEGIPLAFQLRGRDEVSARRQLRTTSTPQDPHHHHFDVALAAAMEEENRRYDAETLKTIRAPLEELLAEGRPENCLPAPDIMQLLLEGRELTAPEEDDEEEMTTATEEDEESTEARDVLVSSAASNTTPREGRRPPPILATTTTNPDDYPIERGRGAAGATTATAASTSSRGSSVSHSTVTSPTSNIGGETPNERARREQRRKKQDAIIRELHHEQRRQKYRRRTAEEVYGPGCAYTPNWDNQLFHDEMIGTPLTTKTVRGRSTSSRLVDFFSPLSPFKSKTKRVGNTLTSASAFDGLSPALSAASYGVDMSTGGGGGGGGNSSNSTSNFYPPPLHPQSPMHPRHRHLSLYDPLAPPRHAHENVRSGSFEFSGSYSKEEPTYEK